MKRRFPGLKVPPDEAQPIVKRFRERYRSADTTKPKGGPTYFHLTGRVNVDLSILNHDEVLRSEPVFVYHESHRASERILYQCTPTQLREYLANLRHFEMPHIYVFPEDMRWCIAFPPDSDLRIVLAGDKAAFRL
jgi:hypothetical protein